MTGGAMHMPDKAHLRSVAKKMHFYPVKPLLLSYENIRCTWQENSTCLSYTDPCSYAKKSHCTPFMACSGGGWIVTGLVVKDRFLTYV